MKEKVYMVTKSVTYKFQVLAKSKFDALDEVRKGYDPYYIKVTRESVKLIKP